ncbi:MAG: glycoside hydrolase family 3 C-terminal domain-containing protein [Eubacteriales bacterium]
MDFKQAVSLYQADPSSENLSKSCAQLRKQMTQTEKISMLSGQWFLVRTLKDILLNSGRHYNCTPIKTGEVKRLGVPPVKFSDGPRGVVMGKSTCFPVSMARGAAFDDELEYEVGKAIAREVIAGGAKLFAGICINLLRNPRWGRAQESYGEDPYLLGRMGAALTRAVQDSGVMACPKHYACNSIENLRFKINVKASERTMQEVYLPHFKKCVDAGAVSIMGAYNKLRGDQCCESKYLLTEVLRGQWGFEGFAISDFMWGVYDVKKALPAGMDIEMPLKYRYRKIDRCLRTGELKMADVDTAVEHILAGLIKITPKMQPQPKSVILSKKHTELARKVAEEGTVLLKNNGLLPLAKGKKIAVAGRYANKINVGDHGSSNVYSPYTVTPYQGLCNVFGKDNVLLIETLDIEKEREKIKSCDAVIVCAGSDYRQEGEYLINTKKSDKKTESGIGGDRYSLRLPADEAAMIHEICALCPNTIVNIIGGSAYIIEELKDEAAAILESFYSGLEGGNALANILCGDVNPSGRLPFTMALKEEDYPSFLFPGDNKLDIEYGYYHGYTLLDKENKKAAYPFGFGLSYTSFAFSDLAAGKTDNNQISIKVNVKNIGNKDGKTVIQVYAGSAENTADNPKKLLKGFKKVFLKSGEEKTFEVLLETDDLRFYDEKSKSWHLDKSYTIYCGENSEKAMGLSAQSSF